MKSLATTSLTVLMIAAVAACGGAPAGESLGRDPDSPPPAIWLPFDGDLTNRGAASLDLHVEGNEVSFDQGVVGQAVFIGGSEDWIEGPVPEDLDLSDGGTLELWVKRDDWVNPYGGGAGGQMFATIDALKLDISVRSARDPDQNRLRGSAQAVGFDVHQAMSDQTLPPLTWTHVAIVYDGEARSATYYVNGEEAARKADVPPLLTEYPNPFKIGTSHRQSQAFRGWIDEVRVYDYARTPEQITESAHPAS